jgi:hypothetical protein
MIHPTSCLALKTSRHVTLEHHLSLSAISVAKKSKTRTECARKRYGDRWKRERGEEREGRRERERNRGKKTTH